MIRDGRILPVVTPPTRMQRIDTWLRRHPLIDFFFVGLGGTVLIIGVLLWLSILAGPRVEKAMDMPISLIGAVWLLTRIFRLR